MVGCVYRYVGLKERTWHASIHTSARKIFYENRRSDRTRWKFNSRRQVISGPRRATEVAELNFGRACTQGLEYLPEDLDIRRIRFRLESNIFMKMPKQRCSRSSLSIYRILFSYRDTI